MNHQIIIRIIVYLLMYIGVPAFAILLNHDTISAVIFIFYILVLIPIGILRMIDFYRTNEGTTKLSRIFNVLFRVPLALFGFLCLVAGLAIVGWVLYNVFVERQKEYSGPGLLLGLSSFGCGVPLVLYGCSTLRSVLGRKKKISQNPEEQKGFEDSGR